MCRMSSGYLDRLQIPFLFRPDSRFVGFLRTSSNGGLLKSCPGQINSPLFVLNRVKSDKLLAFQCVGFIWGFSAKKFPCHECLPWLPRFPDSFHQCAGFVNLSHPKTLNAFDSIQDIRPLLFVLYFAACGKHGKQ
jgi:hypothetical protein